MSKRIVAVGGLILAGMLGGCEDLPEPEPWMVHVCTSRGYGNAHCTGAAGGVCTDFICGNLTECRVDGGVTADGGVPCAETCSGRCGGYNASATCQCDELCSQYGDCCPDLGAVCGTCEARCGDYDTAAVCQCDSYCETAEDCCLDITHWCGAENAMVSGGAAFGAGPGQERRARPERRRSRSWPPSPRE